MTNKPGMTEFLQMVAGFSEKGFIETRCLSQKPGKPLANTWQPVGNLDDVAYHITNDDLLPDSLPCIGPGIRSDIGGSRDDQVGWLNVLWADLDWKRYPGGQEDAKKAIRSFSKPPHCIIRSGGGFHVYWRLAEPWDVRKADQRQAANLMLRRIASALKSDPAVAHVSAVLRVPETHNKKYDPPIQSEITYWTEP